MKDLKITIGYVFFTLAGLYFTFSRFLLFQQTDLAGFIAFTIQPLALFAAGLLCFQFSKSPNFMNTSDRNAGWPTLISLTVFICFYSTISTLTHIYYSFEGANMIRGFIYFLVSSVLVSILIIFHPKKTESNSTNEISDNKNQLSLNDKLQNWFIVLFAVVFSMIGILFGLICIYALPDKSVKPELAAFFF